MAAAGYEIPTAPVVMGVLNVTPDSFSDGGRLFDAPAAAVAHAERMLAEGAAIIDIGGESSRPGAEDVPPAEQIRRTVPVIEALRRARPAAAISIDTRRADVARAALDAGADLVNDISALRDDPDLAEVVARSGAAIVLMHMQGRPATMQLAPHYTDVVAEVDAFLRERVAFAVAAGIRPDRIIVDPGIGFGKTVAHNMSLLAGLGRFTRIAPVLLGTSRKAFIGRILGLDDPAARLNGTTVTHTIGLMSGARILRAHDVAEAVQAVKLVAALR